VPAVFFYISGHGFGHAAREMAVIDALGAHLPDHDIVVRTSAPRWLFDQTVRVPIGFLEGETDTGIVQIDSLRLDEPATIARASEFYRTLPARAATEASLLREHDARLVISDAPPLGCAAASTAGIPSVVLSNFTWDWIYEAYERQLAAALDPLPAIRDAYAEATEAWRLPLHGGFSTIRRIIDVPFVARHARADRTARDVRSDLSLPLDKPLALVSFGGYGVAGLHLAALDCLDAAGIVVTAPAAQVESIDGPVLRVAEEDIYGHGLRYVDLIAAVDVVVTKPGYGIIADCVANHTAMLYTSRGRFAEYDVMVAEMPRFLRCEYLDLDSLLAGRWRDALTRLLRQLPPPEQPRTDGADVVADLIVDSLAASRG
jgi:L-arabinokinase